MKFDRLVSIAVCVAAHLLVTSSAPAQTTLQDLEKSVSELNKSVAAIAASVEKLSGDVSELKAQSKTDDLSSPERLRLDLDDLANVVSARTEEQRRILDAISVQSSSDNYIPRISANMSDPDFAKDFREAIDKTIPAAATLLVTNKTARDEEIVVNGKQFSVMSGASRTFDVPIGYSMLRLEGEEPVRWYIGAPTFKEHIAIETKAETPTKTKKAVASIPPPTIVYDWSDAYYVSPWYPASTVTVTPWRVVP